jgi:capsid protein
MKAEIKVMFNSLHTKNNDKWYAIVCCAENYHQSTEARVYRTGYFETKPEALAWAETWKPRIEAAWETLTEKPCGFKPGQTVWVVSKAAETGQLTIFKTRYVMPKITDDGTSRIIGYYVEDDDVGTWWEKKDRVHRTRKEARAQIKGEKSE